MARLLVLNGVNLGRLGTREPAIYGEATHEDLVAACVEAAERFDCAIEVRQTDDESVFVAWLHEAADSRDVDGVILNPGAWTHTSVALRDAAAMLEVPFVEVHLSNPLAREQFRHTSLTAGLARGLIAGFGVASYRLAIEALAPLTRS